MDHEPISDPDLQESFRTAVQDGRFASHAEAEADFWAKIEESIEQADRGEFVDAEVVRASLRERFVGWPRAAE